MVNEIKSFLAIKENNAHSTTITVCVSVPGVQHADEHMRGIRIGSCPELIAIDHIHYCGLNVSPHLAFFSHLRQHSEIGRRCLLTFNWVMFLEGDGIGS